MLKRMGTFLVLACLIFTSWSVTAPEKANALDPFTGYLMAHFTGETANGEQIYLAHSKDGLHWNDLNNSGPVLLSTVGTRGWTRRPTTCRTRCAGRSR